MYEEKCNKSAGGYVFGLWGLAMHLIVLLGVLNANFHSPILQGLQPIQVLHGSLAKRVLLFVADGLRFRTFIENPPPYLKNVMDTKGVWGVSHTRVPTESRPGNIAIVAGFYEDPSAIFKGWKENPVDFDSVFNQSHLSWIWGSPDIIPIFTKGCEEKVQGESYLANWEDFDGSPGSTTRLDAWVFDRFLEWLEKKALEVKTQNGIILLFHLLGCDTAGHASKPHSKEYMENMKYVDQRIQETVEKVENYFEKESTAYIFTSDHGMTDWGSHGSGSTDETETPLVVWGAGINKSNSRQDVEQVDIASLISALLGVPVPVNNEGILPRQYLNSTNEKYIAHAFLNNIRQLELQVRANQPLGSSIECWHWKEELEKEINKMDQYLKEGKIKKGMKQGEEAVLLAKKSLLYFRRYQRNRLMLYLTLMWLGWIACLFLKVAGTARQTVKPVWLFLTNVGFATAVIILLIEYKVSGCHDQRLLGYGILALVSLWLAVHSTLRLSPALEIRNEKWPWAGIVGTIFLVITMSCGLMFRWVFSISMLLVAAMQRILLKGDPLLPWTAVILAIFPILPAVEPQPRIYIVLISLSLTAVTVAINRSMKKSLKVMEGVRLAITILICTDCIDGRRWISWFILASTPLCIWTHDQKPKERIVGVALGLFCPLALLSASYEPLFLLVLTTHLLSWPLPRFQFNKIIIKENLLSVQDLIRAAFLMLYTLLCFFGTGNMASISSFDPSWTRHFVTIFSPFTMTALILFKLSIPLMIVGCATRALASSTIFLASLLVGDCLSLFLMHNITSQGSWLEIGSAISRFTITIILPSLLLLFYHLSYPFITFSLKKCISSIPKKKHLV